MKRLIASQAKRRAGRKGKSAGPFRPRDRYSRFVNTLKFALPSCAFLILVAVLFWPNFVSTGKQVEKAARDSLSPTGLRNFEMEKPVYVATDDKNRPYRLTATKARQSSRHATSVTLEDPKASITLETGDSVRVSAKSGRFDRKKNRLVLSGDVNVHHDQNYSFRTSRATFDMKAKSAWGKQQVYASSPKATVAAQGFRILDKGATVIFTGKTKVVLNMDSKDLAVMPRRAAEKQKPEAIRGSGQ